MCGTAVLSYWWDPEPVPVEMEQRDFSAEKAGIPRNSIRQSISMYLNYQALYKN